MRRRPGAGRFDRHRLRRAAAAILAEGLRAADPDRLVRAHLRVRGRRLVAAGVNIDLSGGRLVLLAAGKAAGTMARAAEAVLKDRIDAALAVAPAGSSAPPRVRLLLAGHPAPDRRGAAAAEEVLSLAGGLGRGDVLLVLLSGGASALLPAPVPGVSLEEKAALTAELMRAGATIQELNIVRKHLSRLKGGGLARAAAPARVVCLVLSDVVGDDLSTIASGPTVPDPTTFAQALEVLRRRGIHRSVPPSIRRHLEAGARGRVPETAKPGDPIFALVATRIIGSNRLAVAAAQREARRQGLRALVLTTRLEGEAREAARVLVAVLRECVETGRPAAPPVCLLAGGETTVTVRGPGRGGRNQELVVAAVDPLSRFPAHAVVAALATDGIDGASDAAGGVVDQETARAAAALGLAPPAAFLAASDSTSFLGPVGGLIVTGPTGTNVVDLTVLLAGDGLMRRRG
jgi:hydroxypyruvate reductase